MSKAVAWVPMATARVLSIVGNVKSGGSASPIAPPRSIQPPLQHGLGREGSTQSQDVSPIAPPRSVQPPLQRGLGREGGAQIQT
eukprot:6120805-Pyramimonas_sp.AAC.1